MFKLKAVLGSTLVIATISAVTWWYAAPLPRDVGLILPSVGFDKMLTPTAEPQPTPACSQQDLDGWQLVQEPDASSQHATLYSPSKGSRRIAAGQALGQGVVMQTITPNSITLACQGSGIRRMLGYIAPSATVVPVNPNSN